MKNLILLFSTLLFACGVYAQTATTAATTAVSAILGPRNVVKTNLAAYYPLTTANIYYEFKAGQNISVGTGFGYKIPQSFELTGIADLAEDDDDFTWTGDIKPEGLYVNPYVRYYPKGAITGFYFEAFVRYYKYTFTAPYDYEKNNVTIFEDADGEADGFGGGLMIGNQFALGPTMVLDIFAGFGMASGSTHIQTPGNTQLDEADFADIAQEIQDNADANTSLDIPFLGTLVNEIKAGSNNSAAWADIDNVPFPILRFGIVLGAAF